MGRGRFRYEILYLTIGTLGHFGHGKTSLTAAITTVLAKEGGAKAMTYEEIDPAYKKKDGWITILGPDIGYRTKTRFYTHIDLPDHADYIKSMITGAAQMDGAILVVSAADGPTSQTREHIRLARQVGIPALVVFLNKADIVDTPERLEQVEQQVRHLLSLYGFPGDDNPVIIGSANLAIAGDAGKYGEQAVQKLIAAVDSYIPPPVRPKDQPLLMAIKAVLAVSDGGTVVTGRVENGQIRTGETVEIVGLHSTTTMAATSMTMFRKSIDEAEAGDDISVVLSGDGHQALVPGQVLAKPGSINPHTKFATEVCILHPEREGRYKPLLNKSCVMFYFRTTEVMGTLTFPDGMETMMPGENAQIMAELFSPIAMEEGLRFAIREAGDVLGAGIITKILDSGGG